MPAGAASTGPPLQCGRPAGASAALGLSLYMGGTGLECESHACPAHTSRVQQAAACLVHGGLLPGRHLLHHHRRVGPVDEVTQAAYGGLCACNKRIESSRDFGWGSCRPQQRPFAWQEGSAVGACGRQPYVRVWTYLEGLAHGPSHDPHHVAASPGPQSRPTRPHRPQMRPSGQPLCQATQAGGSDSKPKQARITDFPYNVHTWTYLVLQNKS
jgi:hypothetical protein